MMAIWTLRVVQIMQRKVGLENSLLATLYSTIVEEGVATHVLSIWKLRRVGWVPNYFSWILLQCELVCSLYP